MVYDFLAVGMGSFLGGGARFLVSRAAAAAGLALFPLGTFAVNVAGCFLIGLFAAMGSEDSCLSPRLRLLLTTGFCGGFTTFSTFISENASLLRDGHYAMLALYAAGSLVAGLAALAAGHALAKAL